MSLGTLQAFARMLTLSGDQMTGMKKAALWKVPGKGQVNDSDRKSAAAQYLAKTMEGPRPTVNSLGDACDNVNRVVADRMPATKETD